MTVSPHGYAQAALVALLEGAAATAAAGHGAGQPSPHEEADPEYVFSHSPFRGLEGACGTVASGSFVPVDKESRVTSGE
jgi:hypothetical protein